LLFRSEEEIGRWCRSQGCARGASLSLETVWQLAKRWYKNRMEPGFRGRTLAEATAIFQDLGLRGDFWRGPT